MGAFGCRRVGKAPMDALCGAGEHRAILGGIVANGYYGVERLIEKFL